MIALRKVTASYGSFSELVSKALKFDMTKLKIHQDTSIAKSSGHKNQKVVGKTSDFLFIVNKKSVECQGSVLMTLHSKFEERS